MTMLPPSHAEDELRHVAQQFPQWRQRRTTPRGRIPQPLWAQAVARTHRVPLARVANRLGRCPQRLKTRGGGKPGAADVPALPAAPPFGEVPPTWRGPTAEGEVQRADGQRLRLTASAATPALAGLRRTFWESRCCATSRPRVAAFSRCTPSTAARGSMAVRPGGGRRGATIRWAVRSPSCATAPARRANSWPPRATAFGSAPHASRRAGSPGGRLPFPPGSRCRHGH
jgi:hypothetical protein